MKIEPTEAYFKEPENTFREWIKSVKTIKGNLLFIADNGRINGSLLLDVLKLMQRSFEEGQSSPKIKQLEWVGSEGGNVLTGIAIYAGYYRITSTSEGAFMRIATAGIRKRFDTVDEAKAAAQIDFEKRIKECLE